MGQERVVDFGVETGASNAYYQDPPPGPAALWRVRVGRGDAGPSDHRVRLAHPYSQTQLSNSLKHIQRRVSDSL